MPPQQQPRRGLPRRTRSSISSRCGPHPLIGPDAGFPHGGGAESTLGLPTEMSIQRDKVETSRPLLRSRTAAPASSPRRCGSRGAPGSPAGRRRGAPCRGATSRSSRSSATARRGGAASRAPLGVENGPLPPSGTGRAANAPAPREAAGRHRHAGWRHGHDVPDFVGSSTERPG
jgi:hypothetical protein